MIRLIEFEMATRLETNRRVNKLLQSSDNILAQIDMAKRSLTVKMGESAGVERSLEELTMIDCSVHSTANTFTDNNLNQLGEKLDDMIQYLDATRATFAEKSVFILSDLTYSNDTIGQFFSDDVFFS